MPRLENGFSGIFDLLVETLKAVKVDLHVEAELKAELVARGVGGSMTSGTTATSG